MEDKEKNLLKALILLYGQATSMDKSILRNIVGCFQNRNQSQALCGDNVMSKVLKKVVSGGVTFLK